MADFRKFQNVVDVKYAQAGTSINTDNMGMREMQKRVYAQRNSQYLLVKAPPASGKSRALMFVGLDKLINQGRRKVIVAVPEKSIGASFASTDLKTHGFFANWEIKSENNLCTDASSKSKVEQFQHFLASADKTLVCTHATLRFAMEAVEVEKLNGTVIAIDEFHHVSAALENSRLGTILRKIMRGSDAHIVAMTGTYFRGDAVPVLLPEDEAKFVSVTFNYYDQLNGYKHLKTLGIGHHFYQGRYTDAIGEVLDLDRKTIIHIPNVNSSESTKDKYEEVGQILDVIGHLESEDAHTGIISVRRKDSGEILRVANLVDDTDEKARARTLLYLSEVAQKERDAVDIIIALGMAKEGFDWPFAEHAITVGYRASLTEIIQIIGRVTRDSEGKSHAQFTNLIAEPDASQGEVTITVNNILKAITASLLMEQVLAPNFEFKTKKRDAGKGGTFENESGSTDVIIGGGRGGKSSVGEGATTSEGNAPTLYITGYKEPSTLRVTRIVNNDLNDLKATILQDDNFARAAAGNAEPHVINKELIPKIIRERYPDLNKNEVEEVRQRVVVDQDTDGILAEDEQPRKLTATDRLERGFWEIVEFVQREGRAPNPDTRQISERKLGARLEGILANSDKVAALAHLDELGLLTGKFAIPDATVPSSIEELLSSEYADIFEDDPDDVVDIFDVESLPKIPRDSDEFDVAIREKVKNFAQFEPLFKQKQEQLRMGEYSLVPFSGISTIQVGRFFELGGMLLFIAEVGETEKLQHKNRVKHKERLRVIFENGTESSMYRQSLAGRMGEKGGRALVRSGAVDMVDIEDADVESGHIYVLKSKSSDPSIASLENLYKIGFTRESVEKRIAGAASSPTYLMAPVEIVADYRVYNVRPSALENLLHRVFAQVRLEVHHMDPCGQEYDATEWFVVPLEVIDQAVRMIISGDITDFTYCPAEEKLLWR
ncbi:MAG: GIY-YIG nuclease family protein [Actinomycetaceae bacterium]|nr:GIY-YIG nuclease family protein [Actinomycetaceae bacterium]